MVLAAFALKYSVFASVLFLAYQFIVMDTVATILILTAIFVVLAICSSVDIKKIIANLSVLHMAMTTYLLFSPLGVEALFNFSWHHHSIVTSLTFLLVGYAYASTSSRIVRLFVSNAAMLPSFLVIFLILLTLTSDLPWTSNFVVELQFVKSIQSMPLLLVILIIFF